MTRTRTHLAALLLAAALVASPAAPASAQGRQEPAAEPPAEAEEPLIDQAAVEPVRRMVQTLTGAERLSFTVEEDHDVVQADGETIEFGSRSEQTIRRPDRLRMERWERDGRHLKTFYDGRTVTVHDDGGGVFASVDRSADLDSLVDFLREEVGLQLPLADLFASDLRTLLVENVIAARSNGLQTIDGIETDQVALRTREGVGIQLWIRRGEEAVPQRMVITFERARGRPQFRATFSDWDLSPRTPDRMFAFDPPRGARQIPFVLPTREAGAAAAQEDAQ